MLANLGKFVNLPDHLELRKDCHSAVQRALSLAGMTAAKRVGSMVIHLATPMAIGIKME